MVDLITQMGYYVVAINRTHVPIGERQRRKEMTKEQKKAIKRICADYGFEDTKELKEWMKDQYGDELDEYWFDRTTEQECYEQLARVIEFR